MAHRNHSEYRLPFEAPILEMEARLAELEAQAKTLRGAEVAPHAEAIRRVRRELAHLKRAIYANLDPWQTVLVSRHPKRPQVRDYLELICDRFLDLHGDRAVGDDRAIVTGLAYLDDRKVLVVGHQKGKSYEERMACNFGMPHPEGYRKALLKMRMAEKFRLPIVCLIDTPGAYPGIAAEERGQAAVIAEAIMAMSQIASAIVCVVIGEGGSGGALGIGVGDRVAMLEHAYYSVISPEGCASILWKGSERAPQAAQALKMTARDLKRFGIIDDIIPEPLGGAHRDHREAASTLKTYLIRAVRDLADIPADTLLERRYARYRRIGVYHQEPLASPMIADESAIPATESVAPPPASPSG